MTNNQEKSLFFVEEIPPIDIIQIVKYAGAAGGFNPIHFDEKVAKEAGFPTVISQGMLVMGIVSRMIEKYVPELSLQHFDSKFVGAVVAGESLKVESYIVEENAENRTCSFVVVNDEGKSKLEGSFIYKK